MFDGGFWAHRAVFTRVAQRRFRFESNFIKADKGTISNRPWKCHLRLKLRVTYFRRGLISW